MLKNEKYLVDKDKYEYLIQCEKELKDIKELHLRMNGLKTFRGTANNEFQQTIIKIKQREKPVSIDRFYVENKIHSDLELKKMMYNNTAFNYCIKSIIEPKITTDTLINNFAYVCKMVDILQEKVLDFEQKREPPRILVIDKEQYENIKRGK